METLPISSLLQARINQSKTNAQNANPQVDLNIKPDTVEFSNKKPFLKSKAFKIGAIALAVAGAAAGIFLMIKKGKTPHEVKAAS